VHPAENESILGAISVLCSGEQSRLEDTTTAATRLHVDILKQKDEEIARLLKENKKKTRGKH
jgi:hypothetical protein